MITEEERQSIINEAVEKVLLTMPEVVGNLLANQSYMLRLKKEFLDKHPDFKVNEQAVKTVVEKMESDNPGTPYNEILERSVPKIRELISTAKKLNTLDVPRPNRNLKDISFGDSKGNGDL